MNGFNIKVLPNLLYQTNSTNEIHYFFKKNDNFTLFLNDNVKYFKLLKFKGADIIFPFFT